jgi:hypothetical protein
MEWWIIAGLALAAVAVGLATRVRKRHRATFERDGKTIYPLW